MRSDTERNRRRLIRAASRLVGRRGGGVKMTEIAAAAEVSTATAYRHFASVDDILTVFRHEVGSKLLDFSQAQTMTGVELLRLVSAEWVRLVVKHGQAMVQTRSDTGYLARLRTGADYLTVQADALRVPLDSAADELGISAPGDLGMFLWNILFDPREIFDLLNTVGLTQHEVVERLVGACCGALRGWNHSGKSVMSTSKDR